MRFITPLVTSAAMLLAPASTAMAAMLQDPPIRVEVETAPTREVWYTSPMWLAIGAIVVLLIIVLAVSAARGRDGGTTVVR